MSFPRILVIGGMHGNELLGVKLVQLLRQRPLKNVEVLIANPSAVKAGERFIESDLNRSFGADFLGSLETQRAGYLKQVVKPFDVVFDFHNTQTPANNCTFVGVGCQPRLYEAIKQLGFSRCIEATYDCINKYCDNVISIEISVNDPLDDAAYWYGVLKKSARIMQGSSTTKALEVYRFKRRVTWQQKKELQIKKWQPFEPIASSLKRELGVDGVIVPIFIGSKLTEYYATLLSRERTV